MIDWVIKFRELAKQDRDVILDYVAGLLAEKAGVSEEEFWQEVIKNIKNDENNKV